MKKVVQTVLVAVKKALQQRGSRHQKTLNLAVKQPLPDAESRLGQKALHSQKALRFQAKQTDLTSLYLSVAFVPSHSRLVSAAHSIAINQEN